MKRKLIMFAAVCISMGLLTGCSNTEKTSTVAEDTKSTEAAAEETTDAVTEAATEEITEVVTEEATEKTTEATTEEVTEETTEAAIEEAVMYESKNVKITYIGEDESFMGHELKLKIENISDQKLTVQIRDTSINGMMVNPIFSADVTPGKTANDAIIFMKSDFEDNNITKIETLELSFHIYNTDTFDTVEDTETVTLTL